MQKLLPVITKLILVSQENPPTEAKSRPGRWQLLKYIKFICLHFYLFFMTSDHQIQKRLNSFNQINIPQKYIHSIL